ncbi:MAG TPA: PQQ-dependent sugar dehydrogenase [Phycisphaerales bacterium]|nr:PQQ-dependent sugar dehydrogenase [Phycisphaerales bacterium]
MRRICALCVSAGLAGTALAQIDDPIPEKIAKGDIRIDLETIATGLVAPNTLMPAGDGTDRLFVVDQPGQIRMIKNGVLEPTPFLDVSDRLVELGVFGTQDEGDFDERGLLGLAFHPGFADPNSPGHGKLYTFTSEPYDESRVTFTTTDRPPAGQEFNCQSVVAEWTVDFNNPDQVDMNSRRELFRVDKPQFNHNAGMLAFGPDQQLYISLGDGGGRDDENGQPFFDSETWGHSPQGNAQDLSVVYGKILRIDPLGNNSSNGQYGVPADNPFVNAEGVDEAWAYGMRNPFRFSFDSATGDLIVGDVGQAAIEEIDIVEKGGNFGWRVKEGTFLFDPNGADEGFVFQDSPDSPPGMIDPVAQYDHDEGISVIGGYMYRGSLIPELEGKYVFGDFSTSFTDPLGRLFYADLATGEIKEFLLGDQDLPLGMFVKGFGEDASGELYLLAGTNLGPFGDDGVVLRIVPAPGAGAVLSAGLLVALRRRR